MAEQSIEITYPRPNAVVASFRGEHDLSTKRDTSTLLSELVDGYEVVVIDLSEATFIDSSFMHCLALANQRAGGELRLVVSNEGPVRNALEITGLSEAFTVSTTREDALSAA